MNTRLDVNQYVNGILSCDRIILSQAITLIESSKPDDEGLASQLLERMQNKAGHSIRIGVTGVPGVGKSTFIEAFGKHITSLRKKVAVLTIDPSSQLTKGSILGDKTRMDELSKNPLAYIRPSATGDKLGGVSSKTHETILLCEAAGFEVIIVETVGVGQSETSVKNTTDFFLLLMLAGAGDELQGIKKGIMEMADAIVITKADGDNIQPAQKAKNEYEHALHLATTRSSWQPKVLTCSALTNAGIDDIWNMIDQFKSEMQSAGHFQLNRQKQNILWMKEIFERLLRNDLAGNQTVQQKLLELENKVGNERISPLAAARELLSAYHESAVRSKS